MKKNLNKLEQAILNEIVEFNKKEYPSIGEHVNCLKIKLRESTGVGMYVYFEYSEEGINLKMDNSEDICLSSDKDLEMDSLEYGLNYEINITKGKIGFLELVSNGENWNGNYKNFEFSNS